MKKIIRTVLLLCFIVLVFFTADTVYGWQTDTAEEKEGEDYTKDLLKEIDFSDLDAFLNAQGEPVTFSDVVAWLMQDGITGFDYSLILEWMKDGLFYEMEENRQLLIEILLLAIGFSVLKNFAGAFQSAYVSELCFILVYCVLAVLLMQSFVNYKALVMDTLNRSVEFMKVWIPAFSIAMVFSSGTASAAGFYQVAFLVIYLVQWIFAGILAPMIQIYVLFELLNHFLEEEKFKNLTELWRGIICWGMKLTAMAVLGLNVVQNLIAPAKDRLAAGTATKAATLLPGVGNVVNSVSELLVGSGMVIKNCVGAAALLLLLMIGFLPMAKIACLTFFYKLAAGVCEPVADRRISGFMRGMAQGGMLYLKLTGYSLVLLMVTIALTAAVSASMR